MQRCVVILRTVCGCTCARSYSCVWRRFYVYEFARACACGWDCCVRANACAILAWDEPVYMKCKTVGNTLSGSAKKGQTDNNWNKFTHQDTSIRWCSAVILGILQVAIAQRIPSCTLPQCDAPGTRHEE